MVHGWSRISYGVAVLTWAAFGNGLGGVQERFRACMGELGWRFGLELDGVWIPDGMVRDGVWEEWLVSLEELEGIFQAFEGVFLGVEEGGSGVWSELVSVMGCALG